jgi:hypothetical protein
MNLSDWTAIFFDELAALRGRRFEYKPNATGYFQTKTPHYGILIIGEDKDEALVWLLDAAGRTDGPIWVGEVNESTARAAATEANRLIEAMPADGFSFTAWPPGPRDMQAEDTLNAAWKRVQDQIDGAGFTANDEASIRLAIQSVEAFIDRELIVPGSAAPFKLKAAELIRLKARQARS